MGSAYLGNDYDLGTICIRRERPRMDADKRLIELSMVIGNGQLKELGLPKKGESNKHLVLTGPNAGCVFRSVAKLEELCSKSGSKGKASFIRFLDSNDFSHYKDAGLAAIKAPSIKKYIHLCNSFDDVLVRNDIKIQEAFAVFEGIRLQIISSLPEGGHLSARVEEYAKNHKRAYDRINNPPKDKVMVHSKIKKDETLEKVVVSSSILQDILEKLDKVEGLSDRIAAIESSVNV